MEARRALRAVAFVPHPAGLVPLVGLGAGDVPGEVHPFQTGPGLRIRDQVVDREIAVRRVPQYGVRRAAVAQSAGQPAGIDSGDGGQAVAVQPGIEMPVAAIVGRIGDIGAEYAAQRRRGRRLDILFVGPDIADMREGEGDNLGGVGRIGEDFLIAGERGVETQLAQHRLRRAGAAAPEHRPVIQKQARRRPAGPGRGNLRRRPVAGARGRLGRGGRLHRQSVVLGRNRRPFWLEIAGSENAERRALGRDGPPCRSSAGAAAPGANRAAIRHIGGPESAADGNRSVDSGGQLMAQLMSPDSAGKPGIGLGWPLIDRAGTGDGQMADAILRDRIKANSKKR